MMSHSEQCRGYFATQPENLLLAPRRLTKEIPEERSLSYDALRAW